MEKFYTPLQTPSARSRRKAISPIVQTPQASANCSSPYNMVNLDMDESKLKERILEQDNMIRDLQKTIKEDDLRRRLIEIEELEHKLKNANDATNVLQEKLVDKDQSITQLGSEVSSAKFEISTLQTRLNKSRQDVEEARKRNKQLSLEIASLKVALSESKEELRRNLEDVKDQKENMTKREIELRRSLESNFVSNNISTSHNLLNAFQSLSSQLVNMQKTQLTTEVITATFHFCRHLTDKIP
ncbi:unnamed protein product [Strongylus vulgaris]|uniref:Uncharacterized protein n=1 Tax=Strongylus vulgaris TaxID=40348 RepID=A0A3P7K830_STRVU|nr:unnamed protein product [Strongylus vulgaris]